MFISATEYLNPGKLHLACSPEDFVRVSEILKKVANEIDLEVALMPSGKQFYDKINE